jgi:hypothetical protein
LTVRVKAARQIFRTLRGRNAQRRSVVCGCYGLFGPNPWVAPSNSMTTMTHKNPMTTPKMQ